MDRDRKLAEAHEMLRAVVGTRIKPEIGRATTCAEMEAVTAMWKFWDRLDYTPYSRSRGQYRVMRDL